MSASTSGGSASRNRAKAKCISGWTAFDIKQRRKELGLESDDDPHPYRLLSAPKNSFSQNGALLEKPFSSVVVASPNFPSLIDIKGRNLQRREAVSGPCLVTAKNMETAAKTNAYQKVKCLHPWADESLIQDVLAGVNNDVDEALSLLEAMLIPEHEDAENKIDRSNGKDFAPFDAQGISLGEKLDMSLIANISFSDSEESKDEAFSIQLMGAANSLPIEPEDDWAEDDLYLIHRKDAIKMIRSASRHSKAANDAYLRGDRVSAHQLALRAQEEWAAAEKLNAKAAKGILTIRNSNNDQWKDLHGLHASEAVEALRERLQTVESLVSSNCSAMADGVHKDSDLSLAGSLQPEDRIKTEKFGRQQPSYRQRPTLLQVITGKGNHSRGAAALPSAIRNFLSEKGYHSDETRPGVIMVRPKFRQQ